MNQQSMDILEYNKIKESLRNFAISEPAKERIDGLKPLEDMQIIKRSLQETTEAREIVNISSSIPVHSLSGMKKVKSNLEKGAILSPEELEMLSAFIREGKKLKRFMGGKEYVAPTISRFALSISELEDLTEEIDQCIVRGRVDDRASGALSKIRKRISIVEGRIRSKLDGYLRSSEYRGYIQEGVVSQRDGRYVLSVKSEHKRNIEGNVLDVSSSGSTVFVEPAEVKKLQDELNSLKFEEEREVYKILSMLTVHAGQYEKEISINIETMVTYDFLFAKGKYSKSLGARSVTLNLENYIYINQGRHPLLGNTAIPLDFEIGDQYRSLVITGPNTGGKTVVLKTVGLLTMMVQSGLHVPVGEESEFAIFSNILVDIGDGQSIEQSLSTFSSHIKNIIDILEQGDQKTLMILDEIGSGTDPGEGMGIGIAVLEALYQKGGITIATTHYSEIKDFAQEHPGFINGSMDFDIKTLKPLYRLRIGKAGESNAFLIALRLGMRSTLIERAHEITYKESKAYTAYPLEEVGHREQRTVKVQDQFIEKTKKVEERKAMEEKQETRKRYQIGDCVYVNTMNRTGIVCETENNRGEVGVMVMKKKFKINHKRLSLYIEGGELYPQDYDFDIVLKSKEDRKHEKQLSKGHITFSR